MRIDLERAKLEAFEMQIMFFFSIWEVFAWVFIYKYYLLYFGLIFYVFLCDIYHKLKKVA